jgi:hypothetical protein
MSEPAARIRFAALRVYFSTMLVSLRLSDLNVRPWNSLMTLWRNLSHGKTRSNDGTWVDQN